MAESYEVVTTSLTSHVRTLTDPAGELGTALTAANVAVTADAYGQIGTRFAKALGDVTKSLIVSSNGIEQHVLLNGYMVDIKATSAPIGGGDEQFT
jgi:hypothetical protein